MVAGGRSRGTLRGLFNARAMGGLSLLFAVSLISVIPVLYVLVSSFDVSEIGETYRFGFEGWREILVSGKTLSSIAYSFLFAINEPSRHENVRPSSGRRLSPLW